ncbi:MAG: ASKHA domain-containing protein [Eubacterium sp.]|nr:ASKHA domain-containing protein [Eubacterium sp.]
MTPSCGISRRQYLELSVPSEEDSTPYDERILQALEQGQEASDEACVFSLPALRKLYPLLDRSGFKVTVSLAFDGSKWVITDLEAGDTRKEHYGIALDLGSTSIVADLVDCCTGEVVRQVSAYNGQIAFGEDILSRIFYAKDNPDHLEEIRLATVRSINKLLALLEEETGVRRESIISMVAAGNTTMIHFLLGLDAFCVFQSPYAVRTLDPGFIPAGELGISLSGYVYCVPGKANYLGGDILSGMIDTGFYKEDKISLFFDVGTNGELVVGNRTFLLCGAGAAGPALEGGVVQTGMRAAKGAVQGVKLENGTFHLDVLTDDFGNSREVIFPGTESGNMSDCRSGCLKNSAAVEGICGSGIVDLIAELFLNGWVDIRGRFNPDRSSLISMQYNKGLEHEEYAVLYAEGLWFYQSDLDEFVRTKAAAYTMIEYMLTEIGIGLDQVDHYYMAGAFGTHVNKESAVTIGMYPDVDRNRIISAGNSSLKGAVKILLHKEYIDDLKDILDLMSYVQYGAVDNFLTIMEAATALPHTDISRYPSVLARLRKNGVMK